MMLHISTAPIHYTGGGHNVKADLCTSITMFDSKFLVALNKERSINFFEICDLSVEIFWLMKV